MRLSGSDDEIKLADKETSTSTWHCCIQQRERLPGQPRAGKIRARAPDMVKWALKRGCPPRWAETDPSYLMRVMPPEGGFLAISP